MSVSGAVATCEITTTFTNTDAIASGDWELYSGEFRSGSFELSTATGGAANRDDVGLHVSYSSVNSDDINLAKLSDTQAIVAWSDNFYKGRAIILNISGNFVTIGTQATFETGSARHVSVCALSSTQAMVTYQDVNNSNQGSACLLNVVGSAITPIAPVVFQNVSTTFTSVAKLTSTKAIVAYRKTTTTQGNAVVLNVNGNTISVATPVIFETGSTELIDISALSATKAIVVYKDAGNSNRGTSCVLSINSSTVSAGTPVVFASMTMTYLKVDTTTANQAVALFYNPSNTSADISVLNVDGSSITALTAVTINSGVCTDLTVSATSATQIVVSAKAGGSASVAFGFYHVVAVSGNSLTVGDQKVFLNQNGAAATATIALNSDQILMAYSHQGTPLQNHSVSRVIGVNQAVGDSVTQPFTFENSSANPVVAVKLTATKVLAAYTNGGNSGHGTACIIDISGKFLTAGTPFVFNAAATYQISCAELTSTKVILAYKDNGFSPSRGTSVVLSVNGTSISKGTAFGFNSNTAYPSITKLSATKAIVAYTASGSSSNGTTRILNVDGSSITAGSEVVFESSSSTTSNITTLSATKALVVYRNTGNSSQGRARVLTVSNNSISAGSAAVFDSSGAVENPTVRALSATKAIVAFADGNAKNGTAKVLTISNTSISVGAAHVFGGKINNNMSLDFVSATQALLSFNSASALKLGFYTTLTIDGTTVTSDRAQLFTDSTRQSIIVNMSATKRIIVYINQSSPGGAEHGVARLIDTDAPYKNSNGLVTLDDAVFNATAVNYVRVAKISATRAIVAYQDDANSDRGYAQIINVVGGRITFGAPRSFSDDTGFIDVAVLSADRYIVSWKYIGSYSEYQNKAFAIVLKLNLGADNDNPADGFTLNKGTLVRIEDLVTNMTRVVALSATTAMVTYGSSTAKAAFLTINPAANSLAITVNSTMTYNSAAANEVTLAKLSGTQILAGYRDYATDPPRLKAITLNVNGTTISAGAERELDNVQPNSPVVVPLTSTTACVIWGRAGSPMSNRAAILTVAGTSITPGTSIQFNTGSYDWQSASAISPTRVILASRTPNPEIGEYRFFNVSGTSISVEADVYMFASNEISYTSVAALSDTQTLIGYRDHGNGTYGTMALVDKLSSPVFVVDQFVTTISGSDSIDSTFYSDWNSTAVTETLNGQTALYAFSTNSTPSAQKVTGGTFGIIKSGQSAVRKIASSLNSVHGGTNNVWFINTNSTYGSETWSAATTNEAKAAIQQASATTNNQMSGTEFAGISDANLPAFGTQLSLAITLKSTDSTATPSVNSVVLNYDANVINRDETDQYIIEMPATNTIKVTAPSSGTSRNARIYVSK